MEDKEDIVKRLKNLLLVTRAGSDIEDLVLSENQDMVTILFNEGGTMNINIAADSGIAIIKDIICRL